MLCHLQLARRIQERRVAKDVEQQARLFARLFTFGLLALLGLLTLALIVARVNVDSEVTPDFAVQLEDGLGWG